MYKIKKLKPDAWEAWLPLLAIMAEPFGRTVEVFVLIMAIVGLHDLLKNHQSLVHSSGFKTFTLFFLCFWLPALLSLPDAVNLGHSASNVFGMLRFYFAGLFIVSRLREQKTQLWLGTGIALVLLFWFADAWLQLLTGHDVFGFKSYSDNRISGIYGDDAKLGLMIIPFLGVAVAAVKERFTPPAALVFTLLAASVILISGDRASWVSLFAALLFWLWLFRPVKTVFSRKHIVAGISGLILMACAVISTPQFQARLESSLVGLGGDYTSLNSASSHRLPIWETAVRMFADNPINGVGARSFRYAYPDYALPGDIFVEKTAPKAEQTGAYQPHQIVLEFLAETGIIGFSGFVFALWIIVSRWRPLARSQSSVLASGYLISLLAIFFPLNSHQSFFSSDWAQVIWLLVALSISAIAPRIVNKVQTVD